MDVKTIYDPEARKLTALLSGDIDHHTAKGIRTEVDLAIKEHSPAALVLDFASVTFMDSSGIGLVMGRYKIMSDRGGEVLCANPPTYIRKVMQLAGLHRLCRIITTSPDKPPADLSAAEDNIKSEKKIMEEC